MKLPRFARNAIGSWVTSVGGTVAGLPLLWPELELLLDGDPATTPDWRAVIAGAALVVAFLAARDGHRSSEEVGAGADA